LQFFIRSWIKEASTISFNLDDAVRVNLSADNTLRKPTGVEAQ
jgi:hypothetical protein